MLRPGHRAGFRWGMGRAIAFFAFLVLCGFAFVTAHLLLRRPATSSGAPAGPAPVLLHRDDGSLYAVSLQLERLERRLMDEERVSLRLESELSAVRSERAALADQVEALQAEIRRLRRQVADLERGAAQRDASTPPGTTSPSGTEGTGIPGTVPRTPGETP